MVFERWVVHSLFSFWRHGFNTAITKTWDKYGNATLIFGLIWTLAAILIPKWIKKKFGDFDMSLWVTLGIPGILAVVFLIYHFLKAPYEIYKELYLKMSSDLASKSTENQKLTLELQAVTDSKPQLEIH